MSRTQDEEGLDKVDPVGVDGQTIAWCGDDFVDLWRCLTPYKILTHLNPESIIEHEKIRSAKRDPNEEKIIYSFQFDSQILQLKF